MRRGVFYLSAFHQAELRCGLERRYRDESGCRCIGLDVHGVVFVEQPQISVHCGLLSPKQYGENVCGATYV